MVVANELRIGNILKSVHTGEYIKADWLVIKHVIDGNKQSPPYDMSSVYEPIPLTPYILEKCGFKKCNDMDQWYKLSILNPWTEIHANPKHGIVSVVLNKYEAEVSSAHRFKVYLHQLQNLFYALTGNELEVTL